VTAQITAAQRNALVTCLISSYNYLTTREAQRGVSCTLLLAKNKIPDFSSSNNAFETPPWLNISVIACEFSGKRHIEAGKDY